MKSSNTNKMNNSKAQKDNSIELYGKVPPQAIEVEEAVLGALMLERDTMEAVAGIIDTHSFYKESHQKIFEAIKSVAAKKMPIDLLTVTMELKDTGILDEIGGPGFITQLTRRVASAAHIESHARIIAEKYYLRETIKECSVLINLAYADEDTETVSTCLKTASERLEDVFTVADTGSIIKNVLKQTIQDIEIDASKAKENKTPGIPTGFSSLDENTGGWRNGNLIILAGRPGLGKTSFALHFALEAAKAGHWVNFFSLEMNKEDLARILLASESGVYRSNIRDGYLQQYDWSNLNAAIARLENLPIIFKDAAGLTVEQIKATIRKNRKNRKCDLVIVDYLQLVKSAQLKAIRELEVSEISRTLKTVALAENLPVMALSQLNRAADGEEPKLSHLRESGAIEQDADIVCFLFKPEPEQNIIRFNVAKHRRGRLGGIDVHVNNEMTKFSESPVHEFHNTEQPVF